MSIRLIERVFGNKNNRALDFLFDSTFYGERYKEQLGDLSPRQHFDTIGNQKLHSPSPFFDPSWYIYSYSLKCNSALEAFHYYCEEGVAQGHDPHPLFLVNHYEAASGMQARNNPIINLYSRIKSRGGAAISPTPFFWSAFYQRLNPDVVAAGMDPFVHYMTYGWREGRMPSPYFHPRWYLARYPDIANAGVEPLQHFISAGIYEGRQPHYLIDLDYYKAGAPDVVAAGVNPYKHYMQFGDHEGRSAHPLFNPSFYSAGVDLGALAAFAHYSEIGIKTNRSPSPAFDVAYYRKMYPNEQSEPLLSFLLSSPGDRRHFHPLLDGEYQRATALNAARGANPLVDYVQFRSHFNPADIGRGFTSIPAPTKALVKRERADLLSTKESVLVSIVVPCYKSNTSYLRDCINSICSQSYSNWELILVDDGSPDKSTWPMLNEIADRHHQIKAVRLEENRGISKATNFGISLAKGQYLAFVDHDDVLTPNALSIMVDCLLRTEADVVYSDQAYLSATGVVEQPVFKPDWSPTLFNGVMFVGHLLLVRKSTAIDAGLFMSEFDGCQDYEFMLRVSEVTSKIEHVAQILYHWRRAEGSVATDSDAKGKIEPKQARAVNEHFERIRFDGEAVPDNRVPHRLRLRPRKVKRTPVPVDVVWTGSVDAARAARGILTDLKLDLRQLSISGCDASPRTCFDQGSSPWVLFLSDAVQFVNEEWFDYLLMHAKQPDVAFAVPHLYDINSRVVSAGLVVSPRAELLASYVGCKEGFDGTIGTLFCDREVSAIGGACALIERSKVEDIGGISEIFTASDGALNDLSYRATLSGYRNITLASKLVVFNNSGTRNTLEMELDRQFFRDKHKLGSKVVDRYYNSNYSDGSADFDAGL